MPVQKDLSINSLLIYTLRIELITNAWVINPVFVCALALSKERELRLYALPLYNYDKSFLRMHVLSFYTPLLN